MEASEYFHLDVGERERYFIRNWKAWMPAACCFYDDTTVCHSSPADKWQVDHLPDVVFTEIFKRQHPTDRIHGSSLVSKRWNRLVYAKGVWSQVRFGDFVEKNDEVAKRFLRKASSSLRRLCIARSVRGTAGIEDLLPVTFPRLEVFEICLTNQRCSAFEEFSVDFLQAIFKRMPRLQCLSLIFNLEENSSLSPSSYDLRCIASEPIFRNLQSVHLSTKTCMIVGCESFLADNPHVQEIGFHGLIQQESVWKLSDESNTSSRTGLSLRRITDGNLDCSFFLHTTLLGLTFLELVSRTKMRNLNSIKCLNRLRHLHLKCYFHFDQHEFRTLFGHCGSATQFPSCLRHLSVYLPWEANTADAQLLCSSCPRLRSLQFDYMQYISTKEESLLSYFASSLRELRFVSVYCPSNLRALLDDSSAGDAFPNLRCLVASSVRSQVCYDVLAKLFQRWRKLIIWDKESQVAYHLNNAEVRGENCAQKRNWSKHKRIYELLKCEEGFCCVDDVH